MKTLGNYIEEYAQSHQNAFNKKIHYIFVPLIFWSVLSMLWYAPKFKIGSLEIGIFHFVVAMALSFYYKLSRKSMYIMLTAIAVSLASIIALDKILPLFWTSMAVFIFSWVMQFWGHKVEGKKPSFLQDLQFLLIGPLWVFQNIFKF